MTSKADKLPLETEPVTRDNNTILTLKPGDQTLSRLTQLIIVVLCSDFHTLVQQFVFVKISKHLKHGVTRHCCMGYVAAQYGHAETIYVNIL